MSVADSLKEKLFGTDDATYAVVAEFADPERLLEAIRAARAAGFRRLDAFTPYPVHGIESAMGEPRSPLGYVVLVAGLCGTASAYLLQWWTGAVNYPLVIAGKPLFAFEPSIPIMFELTVLFAAFGAVIGMLVLNRLPQFYHPVFNYSRFGGATNDRFLLAVESDDPSFDEAKATELLNRLGSTHTEVVER
jgi:Alternative complex III, ActD subunit